MKLSNNIDDHIADELARRIEGMINEDPGLTQGEVLVAVITVICGTLLAIPCPGCRKLNAKHAKRELAVAIKAALAVAGDTDVGHHVH